jgi:tetratricopeptide (TPR) repeat protein/S1-C subfamily serine protease
MSSTAARGLLPLLVLLAAALAAGPSLRVKDEVSGPAAIYQRALTAVAWVHAEEGKGTGWVIDRSRRWLVTDYHVVGEAKSVEVFFPFKQGNTVVGDRGAYLEKRPQLEHDGYVVHGKVLRRSADVDLALVELASLPPGVDELRLAEEGARPGDRVYLVGNRYDCDPLWVHTSGTVRQLLVWKEGYFNSGKHLAKGVHVILTQAPINEGDSGAPAINERGEVIGVAAAVAWELHGGGLLIDRGEVRRFVGDGVGAGSSDNHLGQPGDQLAPREVYRLGLRSFALVQTAGTDKRASGWVIDQQRRLFLTTADAVGKYETADVTFPLTQDDRVVGEYSFYRDHQALLRKKGYRVTGPVLAVDARRNLALIELPSLPDELVEARLARGDTWPGDPLHLLSNPQRLDALWVYSSGNVRQLGNGNLGHPSTGPDPAVVLVQAPLGEGDGGGLALDRHGEVVGMISGKVGAQQQVAFCLAVAEIRAFLDEHRPRWDPRNAAELCSRGAVFVKAGRFDRALGDFNEAVRLDSNFSTAYSERGNVYRLQGRFDDALADCDRALRLDPQLVTAFCHRAEVRIAKNEPAKAVADCDAALQRDRNSALAYCVRADARRLLGDLDRAAADCEEAIWNDRRLSAAHLVKGNILMRKDELAAAIAAYTSALQLDPQLADAFHGRAEAHLARSDVTAALADYADAIKLRPDDARAYRGRGRCLAARGDHDAAMADCKTAIRLDGNLAEAYVDRGAEYLFRSDLDKGFADLGTAIDKRITLAVDVLAVVERRAAELGKDDVVDLESVCSLCRRALEVIKPAVRYRPEVATNLDAALAAAAKEADVGKRASLLRHAVAAVRGKLTIQRDG